MGEGKNLSERKFSSPREEALEMAYDTRKKILEGSRNAVSIVRSCLVIANILNKYEMENWCLDELTGYTEDDVLPEYRFIQCFYEDSSNINYVSRDFTDTNVTLAIHPLSDFCEKDKTIRFHQDGKIKFLDSGRLMKILSAITDNCLFFLNGIIAELQYGGMVEFLMEEIRKNTDEKLANLDVRLRDETQSLFLNLTSTNPADWNKVAHSCRKIIKILADNVFPVKDAEYTLKDGKIIKVGEPHSINRLCAFLDQKVAGEERKFLIAELEYFESYLRQIVEYTQMGEHKPSIEKYHADMMAIHTYLISSEILKHYN